MLALSRRVGETVSINGNIVVTIARVRGNRVTIGIEAPADVRIVRGELKPDSKPKQDDRRDQGEAA